MIDRLVRVVDEGRQETNGRSSLTRLTAEGIVGGVASVIHGRMACGDRAGLVELANPFMGMIVLPYLGANGARRESERPLERVSAIPPTMPSNPLKGLDMRLTYRTVRTLAAIAGNPGASNRVIGDVAGIGDQGQISKLLTRLEKLGLIENTCVVPARGGANAWRLTEHGKGLADVVAT